MARVVLCDMDDTIFDHALTSQAALRRLRIMEPQLHARSLLELWTEYSRLLEEAHPAVVSGAITVEESRIERFRRLAEFGGRSIPRAEAERLSKRYRANYRELRRAVPGARRLLERLHQKATVGVVTNNQVAEQEEKLAFLGMTSLVDFMVVSEAAGVAKPNPRIFEIALARAEASPENAVMIGDSWENDVLGARGAGIRAVWFNRYGSPRPIPLDVPVVGSFRRPAEVERLLLG
jgi:HAD superfamily hydrolase (TIGR01549 family)